MKATSAKTPNSRDRDTKRNDNGVPMPEIQNEIVGQDMNSWEFDPDLCDEKQLNFICCDIFQQLGIMEQFEIPYGTGIYPSRLNILFWNTFLPILFFFLEYPCWMNFFCNVRVD
jgi:hypothetical protein